MSSKSLSGGIDTGSAPSLKSADLFNVQGLNVLVTGGGRGIGLMIAAGFVANGAHVFISSRDAATIEAVAAKLTQMGPGTCRAFAADLSSMKGIATVADTLKSLNVTQLHVLVNNSGSSWGMPIAEFSEQGWDKVMDLNVKSPFFLIQALLPLLEAASQQNKPSRIINIGSVTGIMHQSVETYSYDPSKAAIHSLTRKLAERLGPKITVNAVAPGFIRTKMSKNLPGIAALVDVLPMKRDANAADMAGIALFLSSPAASWITGQIIAVDGGHLIKSNL